MPIAALTPSAAATITNCASRDASPATKTPATLVSLRIPGVHGSALVEPASHLHRQVALQVLAGGEKQRVGGQRRSRGKRHGGQHAAGVLQTGDPGWPEADAVALQDLAAAPFESVPLKHSATCGTPGPQRQRQANAAHPLAEHREGPVSPLPSRHNTDSGALRPAVTGVDAGDRRQVIGHAGRDQQKAGFLGVSVGKGDAEMTAGPLCPFDRDVPLQPYP